MKPRKNTLAMISILALAALGGCLSEPIEPELPPISDTATGDTVTLSFLIPEATTKSSVWTDTDEVHEIYIVAYSDGKYAAATYSKDTHGLSLTLVRDRTYNLYAVANMGETEACADEQEFLESEVFSVTDPDAVQEMMPMCWSRKGLVLSHGVTEIEISLDRLAARISFSVDRSLLTGMSITSVRLRSCALSARFFPGINGSRIETKASAGDGDYASEADLALLNSSGTAYFYALENCQGTLLPDNGDPWQKVPDSIGEKAGLCTYLEVGCAFGPESVYDGEATYRLYIGRDNTTNFDIRRNSDIRISLVPTMPGLKEISWKVETNLEYRPGFVSGYQDGGPYDISSLYAGVMFGYRVEFSDQLFDHFAGDASACSLAFESENGGRIDFSPLMDSGEGTYMSTGTAFRPGTGCIWLLDGTGAKIQMLSDGVAIRKPTLILSPSRSSCTPYDEQEDITINGKSTTVYVYLTDGGGRNIRHEGYFSAEPFHFGDRLTISSNYAITGSIKSGAASINGEYTYPYTASYTLSCSNSGSSHQLNLELADAVSSQSAFSFSAEERNLGLEDLNGAWLNVSPVKIEIVDNRWAKYHSTQHTVLVDNPSNLAAKIDILEVMTDNPKEYNAISTREAIEYIDKNCLLNQIPYISGKFWDGERTIYGNMKTIQCERNSYGNRYDLQDDGRMAMPLENVSLDIIQNSTQYFKSSNDKLYIFFECSFIGSGDKAVPVKCSVYDHLSDGSMTMDIIYGDDPEYGGGYDMQGIWTYYRNRLEQAQDATMKKYGNLDMPKIKGLYERHKAGKRIRLIFTYNQSDGYMYVSSPSNPGGVSVDIRYSGTVQGYVQTHPKGTWFAGQDNHCSASYSSQTYTVVPVPSRKPIGRHIYEGMNGVYAQTFFDSYNKVGASNSYQHSAHPTSVSCTIYVKTTADNEYYPVEIPAFTGTAQFYHSQDGTTYYSPVNGNNGGNYTYVNTVKK